MLLMILLKCIFNLTFILVFTVCVLSFPPSQAEVLTTYVTDKWLTVILFVNDSNFGPVQEGHHVLESWVQQRLGGVQINGELPVVCVQVQSRFQVWDVQSVAYRVYVRPKQWVWGSEHSLHAEVH